MHRFIKIIQWWQISWMHSQKSWLIELRLFAKYRISSPSSTLKAAASSQSHSQCPRSLLLPLVSLGDWAAPAWVQSSGKNINVAQPQKGNCAFTAFSWQPCVVVVPVCMCVCVSIDVDFPMSGIGRGGGGEKDREGGFLSKENTTQQKASEMCMLRGERKGSPYTSPILPLPPTPFPSIPLPLRPTPFSSFSFTQCTSSLCTFLCVVCLVAHAAILCS